MSSIQIRDLSFEEEKCYSNPKIFEPCPNIAIAESKYRPNPKAKRGGIIVGRI